MRILRRCTAVIVALTLLQLNSTSAEAACAMHGEHDSPAQAAHADARDHGSHHASPEQGENAGHSTDCQHPAEECCEAMTSCASSLDVSATLRDDFDLTAHDAVSSAALARPHSLTTAPEPPPPKA